MQIFQNGEAAIPDEQIDSLLGEDALKFVQVCKDMGPVRLPMSRAQVKFLSKYLKIQEPSLWHKVKSYFVKSIATKYVILDPKEPTNGNGLNVIGIRTNITKYVCGVPVSMQTEERQVPDYTYSDKKDTYGIRKFLPNGS